MGGLHFRGGVENWKSDMDGILIFAGLFSAILTAFLIESYKTLSPDQSAIAIAVLAQISLQLDPHSNTSSIDMSTFAAAPPSPTSLACNTLHCGSSVSGPVFPLPSLRH
ncbi:hypothetical protein C8R44DRAFT_722257 [Mycena epipterygia]|nr:hypothetical protein C8R44DRAFT_722257 [Mycena epipterygia]